MSARKTPANWKFRAGRPRWEPGPGLRQAGWRGLDLKDDQGRWLSEGASIDQARAVNQAVAAWRAGQLVPEAFAALAPAGAAETPALSRQERLDRRSIGALIDRYLASQEFKGAPTRAAGRTVTAGGLGEKTQREYASKLSRLIDVLAGHVVQPGRDAKPAAIEAYQAARAAVRAMSVDALDPPEFGSAERPLLYTAYWIMREHAGHHMANGALRVASAWLEWCLRIDGAVRLNAAKLVDLQEAPGRLRVGSWDELAALVAAADKLALPSIGDAVILGVDLSWNQGDRLALTWAQITETVDLEMPEGGAGKPKMKRVLRVRGVRRKTGRAGETRLLDPLGVARVDAIRARQGNLYGKGNTHTRVIVCERTGAQWKSDHYRHAFAEVRAEAAKACPSVASLNDQDLRDTAVTVAYEAGLTEPEIASRTLHSLKRIREILDAHYGEITRTVGDNGARKLEAHLKATGVTL